MRCRLAADSEMQKHGWIIEVCEDLKKYAKKHNLAYLEGQLDTALTAAKHDALLARVDTVHHAKRDCAVLGANIGVCNHQGTDIHDTERYDTVRCQ